MGTQTGTSKNDWLIGTSGVDNIWGLGGNDTLKGGGGADYLSGGSGIDTASYVDSTQWVVVDLMWGRVTADVNASLNLDSVLKQVAEGARELSGSDVVGIALRETDSDAMVFHYWSGVHGVNNASLRVGGGTGLAAKVMSLGRAVRTDRYASDPSISCGASDGQEIPIGLMGGKNGRASAEPEEAETDVTRDGAAAVGERGDEPAHPTISTLASVSNVNDDFIRHLSLWLTRPVFWPL